MLKFLEQIRNKIVISLIAYSLVLIPSIVVKAQGNSTYEIEIPGITYTLQGRTLTVPNFEHIPSGKFNDYLKGIERDIKKMPQFKKQLQKAVFTKINDKLPKFSQSIVPGFLAIADNYFGRSEYTDVNVPDYQYVSGTVTCSGRNVPIAPPVGLAASYLELSDYAGKGGASYGKRWISGDQLVEGGCGILKTINSGKEPVGRLVWGTDAFKIVLNSADERTQEASFSAYMRLCANLPLGGKTCSPYFISLPWFPVQGNNLVMLGRGAI